jgi:hypothetical protein
MEQSWLDTNLIMLLSGSRLNIYSFGFAVRRPMNFLLRGRQSVSSSEPFLDDFCRQSVVSYEHQVPGFGPGDTTTTGLK